MGVMPLVCTQCNNDEVVGWKTRLERLTWELVTTCEVGHEIRRTSFHPVATEELKTLVKDLSEAKNQVAKLRETLSSAGMKISDLKKAAKQTVDDTLARCHNKLDDLYQSAEDDPSHMGATIGLTLAQETIKKLRDENAKKKDD